MSAEIIQLPSSSSYLQHLQQTDRKGQDDAKISNYINALYQKNGNEDIENTTHIINKHNQSYSSLPPASPLPPGASACIDFLSDTPIHLIDLAETFRQIHHRSTAIFQFIEEGILGEHDLSTSSNVSDEKSTTRNCDDNKTTKRQLKSFHSSSQDSLTSISSVNSNINKDSSNSVSFDESYYYSFLDHHYDLLFHSKNYNDEFTNYQIIENKNEYTSSIDLFTDNISFGSNNMKQHQPRIISANANNGSSICNNSNSFSSFLPPSTCIYRLKNCLWRKWWIQKHQSEKAFSVYRNTRDWTEPKALLCPLFLNEWGQNKQFTSSLCSPTSFTSLPSTSIENVTYSRFNSHNIQQKSNISSSSSASTNVTKGLKGILKKHTQTFSMEDIIQFAKVLKQRGCSAEQRKNMLLSAWEIDHPVSSTTTVSNPSTFYQSPTTTISTTLSLTGTSTPLLMNSPSSDLSESENEDFSGYFDHIPELPTPTSPSNYHFNGPNESAHTNTTKRSPSLVCFHWKVEQCIILDPPPISNFRKDSKLDTEENQVKSSESTDHLHHHHIRSRISPKSRKSPTIKPILSTVLKADSSVHLIDEENVSGPQIVKVKPTHRLSHHASSSSSSTLSSRTTLHSATLQKANYNDNDDDVDNDYNFGDPFKSWLNPDEVVKDTINIVQEKASNVIQTGVDMYQNAKDILSVAKSAFRNFMLF